MFLLLNQTVNSNTFRSLYSFTCFHYLCQTRLQWVYPSFYCSYFTQSLARWQLRCSQEHVEMIMATLEAAYFFLE